MTALIWDRVGERTYQTGVDRGVLYLSDGTAVAWNGLISVEEQVTRERRERYLDGVKYLDYILPGDFSAQLKAFTYPDEFEQVNGVVEDSGLFIHDQRSVRFGLSYRTLIGDDVSGVKRGYKIHLLYNLTAIPDAISYTSLSNQPVPISFSWSLAGIPEVATRYRPTVHISLDSTKMDPGLLVSLETMLYGDLFSYPRLPPTQELLDFVANWDDITIWDNGDGTWTAFGNDSYVTMTDATTFQIRGSNAAYLDLNTFTISSST